MKKLVIMLSLCAVVFTSVSCSKKGDYTEEEKNLGDSLSLAIGNVMGARIRMMMERQASMNPEQEGWNIEKLLRGMESVLYADTADNKSFTFGQRIALDMLQPVDMMTADGIPADASLILKAFKASVENDSTTADEYMKRFQELNVRAKQIKEAKEQAQAEAEAAENQAAGAAFVENLKKEDALVKTAESGLVYKIENEGAEPKVQMTDKVKINYTGTTLDGTVFDKTDGNPREMKVSGFIPGFAEGLTLLGQGGKATLYIPGELAYGTRGIPSIGIGPGAMLVFDVEIVEIVPAEVPQN